MLSLLRHLGAALLTVASRIGAVGITAMQIAGGLYANSLGLLSDAGHNASDVGARHELRRPPSLVLPATSRRTFAYKRGEVLSALLNAVLLVAVSGWVFYAAVLRIGCHTMCLDIVTSITSRSPLVRRCPARRPATA